MDNADAGQPIGVSAAGTRIADRYRLDERIAGGGMGDVWRAMDEVLRRTVAVKLLRPEYAEDEQFRERLRREARAASAINDVGVVPVYDFGEIERDHAPPLSYLVMEYVDGPSLSAEVAALGPLGAERTVLILEQTASALQAAHDAGVIHRDVKPGNILVTPQGDVKITDFGIARASDAMPLTRTGMMTGTAKYLSPEQARGLPATAASDVYSLGIVAYACLTGDVPFREGNDVSIALAHVQQEPPELPADVPAGLRQLITRMLEKNPTDRPESASAVAAVAHALRRGDAAALGGQHPFPATAPMAVIHPTGSDDPTPVYAGLVTGAMAAATVSAPVTGTAGAPVEEDSSTPRGRGMRRGAIALLLLLLGAVAFIVWQSGGTQVPNVVGMDRDEAETVLKSDGLRAEFTTEDAAGEKEGIVVKQGDEAGSKVDEGSTITLTVASGKVDVPTDELLGASYEEAEAVLRDLGLKARERTAPSTEESGTVIGVSPEGRAKVGDTVTLTVAARSEPSEPETDDNGSGNGQGGSTPTTNPTTQPTTSPTTSPPTSEPPTTGTEEGAAAD